MSMQEMQQVCAIDDLVPGSGVCVRIEHNHTPLQVALFYLPDCTPPLYAVSNWDPIGQANVLSRGIIGSIDGAVVVASPLYKQHYDLLTGRCLEDETASLIVYAAAIDGERVLLSV